MLAGKPLSQNPLVNKALERIVAEYVTKHGSQKVDTALNAVFAFVKAIESQEPDTAAIAAGMLYELTAELAASIKTGPRRLA